MIANPENPRSENLPKPVKSFRQKLLSSVLTLFAIGTVSLILLYCLGLFHPFALYYLVFSPTLVSLDPGRSISEYEPLIVGTWQMEIPDMAIFDTEPEGWRQTRLEIKPDGTFVLTGPSKRIEWLEGFQGTLNGKWQLLHGHVMEGGQGFGVNYWDEELSKQGQPTLRAMKLVTIRPGSKEKRDLRFLPMPGSMDDFVVPPNPAWRRVEEK